MIKNFPVFVLFFVVIIACNSQVERVENKLMQCTYSAFPDQGESLKTAINNYEQLLIFEGVLQDASGQSYRNILEQIANNESPESIPSRFFGSELENTPPSNMEQSEACYQDLLLNADYYDSKFARIERAMIAAMEAKNIYPSLLAKNILEILDADDFELDFYKLRTFSVVGMFNVDTGISKLLPTVDELKEQHDLTNALIIGIDNNSEIWANQTQVGISKLQQLLSSHIQTQQEALTIVIQADSGAAYSTYIQVQNVITGQLEAFRARLAQSLFGKTMNDLSPDELAQVKKAYPKNIIELPWDE